MLTFDMMVDALDDLRTPGGGKAFDRILNCLIRSRGVGDEDVRDEVRSSVYDALAKKIRAGEPSVLIAPQIGSIVRHKVADEQRRRRKSLKVVPFNVEDNDVPAPLQTEDLYEASETYGAVCDALSVLRDSSKTADRRYFAVLYAARLGESPAERLRRDFGEDISAGAAAQVLKRAREKLREMCGMPKDEKVS